MSRTCETTDYQLMNSNHDHNIRYASKTYGKAVDIMTQVTRYTCIHANTFEGLVDMDYGLGTK